jgi:DNA-binding XRE family transcriptional regulator
MGGRARVADWSAGLLAVLVLVLGGFVVLKPAIDHWNDLYRGDPFEVGTTTHQLKRERAGDAGQATTTITEEAASPAERVLGRSGLIFLRLIILALAAFLAAATLRRAILGSYSLRIGPARPSTLAAGPEDAVDGTLPAEAAATAPLPTENGLSALPEPSGGPPAPSEPSSGSVAWAFATLVASRREALGLSQRELAKRAGISHTVVSRIESGQHAPSAKTVERLADVLS